MAKEISTVTPGFDAQRRLLLGGMAGAIATAMFSGCGGGSNTRAQHSEVTAFAANTADVPAGMTPLAAEDLAWARRFLASTLSVDVHCHPGMFFFAGQVPEDAAVRQMAATSGFQALTVADMVAGQCSAGLFSTVADLPLIGSGNRGLYARREFREGEAFQNHNMQLATLQRMVESGLVAQALNTEDLYAIKITGTPAAIFASEGGDFLEQKLDRLQDAWQAGLRCISLVHYHVNHIGDIQTAPAVHGGLTAFGKQAVKEMNRLGMIIDMAHATYETTRDAVQASSQPIMLSHSFLADEKTRHPRLLSADHARMVAESGGLIGTWPTGIGNADYASFIDRTMRLVDSVGIDHVGLGTDMDANYKPVFSNYRQMPYLPFALRQRGMAEAEIAKLLGGNFVRLFTQVSAGAG